MTSPDDLEAELRALGDLLDVPAPPPAETAAAVRARLERPAPRYGRRRRWALVAVIVTVVLALTAAATVWVIRSQGVMIRIGDPGPFESGLPIPEGDVTLDEARMLAQITVRVPSALGEPDRIRVGDQGRLVTMTWAEGARFDQFYGGVSPLFIKQMGPGEWPEEIPLGDGGWWLAKPHALTRLTRQDGKTVELRAADATLVWGQGDVGYRLEGIKDKDRAVEVARSVR